MRGWPVLRPTHAPATTLKTNGNSAPPQKQKIKAPRAAAPAAACVAGRSCGQHMLPQQPSKQTATAPRPKQKIKAPRAAAPAAACVAGRSSGQHMLPQQPSKQTATAPRPKQKIKAPRAAAPAAACVAGRSRGCERIPLRHRRQPPRKKQHRHSGIFISRKRKENIRNLRRKAGMTPHWRECEAPLRRTQRDGADETILCRPQTPRV